MAPGAGSRVSEQCKSLSGQSGSGQSLTCLVSALPDESLVFVQRESVVSHCLVTVQREFVVSHCLVSVQREFVVSHLSSVCAM